HFNFIKDLPKIESKISLIDTKDDAEKVLTFLSKYNFSPIKSSVLNQLKKTAKELSMSSSLDTSQNIKFYGSRIRMILEHIINKEEKEVFSQRLEKEIKEKNIDKSDKKVLLSIYKSTNLFHHNSDFEVNRNLEVKIKNDIIKLSEIAKRNKVKINKFEKEIKWATV
ncbi:MAG: hypothetical protein KAG14_03975, partial [Mycoplasmataceae bacterium]|nr:hypothetical protein [Mycoplasmataceae bacterium]